MVLYLLCTRARAHKKTVFKTSLFSVLCNSRGFDLAGIVACGMVRQKVSNVVSARFASDFSRERSEGQNGAGSSKSAGRNDSVPNCKICLSGGEQEMSTVIIQGLSVESATNVTDKILKGTALAPGWVKCSHGAFNPDSGLGCAACVRAYWERQLSLSGLSLAQIAEKDKKEREQMTGEKLGKRAATPCPGCGSIEHYDDAGSKVICASCGLKYDWKASRSGAVADAEISKGKN